NVRICTPFRLKNRRRLEGLFSTTSAINYLLAGADTYEHTPILHFDGIDLDGAFLTVHAVPINQRKRLLMERACHLWLGAFRAYHATAECHPLPVRAQVLRSVPFAAAGEMEQRDLLVAVFDANPAVGRHILHPAGQEPGNTVACSH